MKPQTEMALFGLSAMLLLLASIAYFYQTPDWVRLPGSRHTLTMADVAGSQSIASSALATSSAATSMTAAGTTTPQNEAFSTTTYQYKMLQTVDPCTLNTLGAGGWRAVSYGVDPDSGNSLTSVPGKDAACKNQGIYRGLLWAVFELSTSTTDNTVTTDTASAVEYKIVPVPDPCKFNTYGGQGWRATQFGTSLLSTGGFDETCKKSGVYNTLDWVMFERPLPE